MPLPLAAPVVIMAAGAARRYFQTKKIDNNVDDDDAGVDEYRESDDDNDGDEKINESEEEEYDSDYTYETIDSDDGDDGAAKKGGAWFSFLRGSNNSNNDKSSTSTRQQAEDDMFDDDDDDDDIVVSQKGHRDDNNDDDNIIPSDRIINHVPLSKDDDDNKEEDEAQLLAEALRRVQERIQKNGGNLYNSLDLEDRLLVDEFNNNKKKMMMMEERSGSSSSMSATNAVEEEVGESTSMTNDVYESNNQNDDENSSINANTDRVNNDSANYSKWYEQFTNLQKEIDTINTARQRNNMTNATVQELITQICCKLDNIDITGSNDEELRGMRESIIQHAETVAQQSSQMEEEEKKESLSSSSSSVRPSVSNNTHEGDNKNQDTTTTTTTAIDDNNTNEKQQPTIDEQHKLLTLAAKHDRVDVIKSLLNDSASNMYYEILLMGTISNGRLCIPPPLHVAVKHGSVNAASCLLRMGADPSLRPPSSSALGGTMSTNATTCHNNNNDARGSMDKDAMTMEDYNTYVGLSAWEVAFGDTVTYTDDDYDDANNEKESELNTTTTTMGWFGRRSYSVTANTNNDKATSTTSSLKIGKSSKKKTEPSLNISPTKLVGIRNAFMSEAMRAIGADEVNRLMQLLNSGIHPMIEVMAGKTLLDWAIDMDAMNCRELLSSFRVEEDVEDNEDDEDSEAAAIPENTPLNKYERNELSTKFDHLYDLSMSDIRMLIAENHILIPQLTNCRDDMAMETSICHSILHGSDEGGGVLTSDSMIDVVRGLKDQRTRAEESCIAWQAAWEEREDELNFFWEEVLDDELREELCVIFDQVDEDEVAFSLDGGGMSTSSIVNGQQVAEEDDNVATIDEQHILIEQFIELDNRVNELRSSITSLAEESSTCLAEINRQGMNGALLMTKSLRDEVKEWEKKLRMARVGESLCRRKIDIIQQSIDERCDEDDGDEEIIDQDKTTCMPTPTAGDGGKGDDDEIIIEDYQLRAIIQQNQQVQVESISSPQCNKTEKTDMTVGESNDIIAGIDIHENELRRAATAIVEPTHAITNGLSTAMVVHPSSQEFLLSPTRLLWELFKQIVGSNFGDIVAPRGHAVTKQSSANNLDSQNSLLIMTV